MDTGTDDGNRSEHIETQRIGSFVTTAKIGQGGMGLVYKAVDPTLNRSVALKLLPPHLASDVFYLARFHREATAAAKFNHPNLVQVYAAGEDNGIHFIAMEFVEGESVKARIKRKGRLDCQEALTIAICTAKALQYAWNKAQLIHRDIKPDNILISVDDEVKLADLGLAKILQPDASQVTQSGTVLGSPNYISPEQAQGTKEIDFRADIYSLGCTLYHMLTGHLPYETNGDAMAVLHKHIYESAPDILRVRPDCPVEVAKIVSKMLQKKPADRYNSYDELIADLTRVRDQLQSSAPSRGRTGTVYAAAGAIVLAMAGLLMWSLWKNRFLEPIRPSQPFVTSTGMELVYVPPGDFLLGSTAEEQLWAIKNGSLPSWVKTEGAQPRKASIKDGFWMGRTEVTVGQWKQFVAATGYVTDGEKIGSSMVPQGSCKHWKTVKGANWRNPNYPFRLEDNHPVSCISWNDAMAFCEWLNEQERKKGRLPHGYIIRLPFEIEWEYACRAGMLTKFWWGDAPEDGADRLNLQGANDGFEFVSPVDQFGALGRNRFGLADMLGNVNEWCLDAFDVNGAHVEYYKGNNPKEHAFRGASFGDIAATARCAYRFYRSATYSHASYGFRVVCGKVPSDE